MSESEWKSFKERTGYKEDQPDHIPDSSPAKKEYKNYTEKFSKVYKVKAAKDREIRENVERIKNRQEDRESRDYWQEKNRERERPERVKERERPERDREPRNNTPAPKPSRHYREPPRQKARRGKRVRAQPGIALPQSAMRRIGGASQKLAERPVSRLAILDSHTSVNFGSYRDPAAGAHLFGGGGGSSGYHDPFASQFQAPGHSSSGIFGDLRGGIFGSYRSPFSGMFGSAPRKKSRKVSR